MAFSEIYVDPSIAADSGTGTIGDPFGDLEYAIEQTTFDTTNGTRVNIKAGTDEVLAAKLETAMADTVTTVAWVPTEQAPMVIQGYTSVAGDGGIGGISGGGAVNIFGDGTLDYIKIIHMHCHNSAASGGFINLDEGCFVSECEVDTVGAGTAVFVDSGSVQNCYVHDFDGVGIRGDASALISNNWVDPGDPVSAGQCIFGNPGKIINNIIVVPANFNSVGIYSLSNTTVIKNNSIYAQGAGTATGKGIQLPANTLGTDVSGNLVEGFGGVGGAGIEANAGGVNIEIYRGNAVYNCTTAYSSVDGYVLLTEDNETLTASPFVDAAAGDFSPVDTGNIKEGSLPQVIGGNFV